MDINLRGKCKEMAEEVVKNNPGYRLVRGYYHEPLWGKKERQQHWWAETQDGEIVDPTKDQFPTGGNPLFYEEFTGILLCDNCGKEITEEEAIFEGNGHYALCSQECCIAMFM